MSDSCVYIVSAVRTPIGSFCGTIGSVKAHDLGAIVIKSVLEKASVKEEDVSMVVMGQALTAGQGQNTARQAAMKAGIPYPVPSFTINQLCGSGLKSVVLGCQSIKAQDADIVVCGGQESMSQSQHSIYLRSPTKLGDSTMVDTMLKDGLTDAFKNIHMGVTAENVAKQYNISREQQDQLALESQQRAVQAIESGHFAQEIVPVRIEGRDPKIFSEDEYPRKDTTLDKLKKLRPAFIGDGSVTAGNASGINDGAAAVLLMSQSELKKRNAQPLAKIVAYAEAGVEPQVMGLGPIPAVKAALKKAGWTTEDVDLFELNEAFASISIAVVKELQLDASKVNVSGGAIALGHPIGASGARVLVTLIHALIRTNKRRGIAALCIGGGMGIAMAIERV